MSTIGKGKKRVVGLAIAAALFSVSLALGSTTVAHAETPPLDTMTCQVFPSPQAPPRDQSCSATITHPSSPNYAPQNFM
jgi:hypothetical protein